MLLNTESLQTAFGCSQLVCRGTGCWLWRACAGRNGPSSNLSALAWAPLPKAFLWWALSGWASWCSPCCDLPGAGPVVQPGMETSPGAAPVWPDGAFPIPTCFPRVTTQNFILILMQRRTLPVGNHSVPSPGCPPSVLASCAPPHSCCVTCTALTDSFLAAALMRTSRCAW